MTVYFQGTEREDFLASTETNYVATNTNANAFNAANGRAGVYVRGEEIGAYHIETHPFTATEFWTHFSAYLFASTYGSPNAYFCTWIGGGIPRIALYCDGGWTLSLRYWNGSAWVTIGSYTVLMDAVRRVIDVYIRRGTPGEVRVYVNNVPAISTTVLDTTFGGAVSSYTAWRGNGCRNYFTGYAYYAEVIVADWNTIGAKLVTRIPDAAGSWNEWTGAGYTAVDEAVPAGDFMVSGTANQRFSASFADFPAPGTGESIEAVRMSAALVKDAGGPQSYNYFARIGGTDHDGPDLAAPATLWTTTHASQLWNASPATSGPWSQAELNAAEFGIRSRA